MPFDTEKFVAGARNGDVAGVAINTVVALQAITRALEMIREGQPPSEEVIAQIRDCSRDLTNLFNDVSGWTAE